MIRRDALKAAALLMFCGWLPSPTASAPLPPGGFAWGDSDSTGFTSRTNLTDEQIQSLQEDAFKAGYFPSVIVTLGLQ